MEFENKVLTFIANDEGRIRPIADSVTEFKFEYDIKDHLGNVRMTMISGAENKYTYNGKELNYGLLFRISSNITIYHSQFSICEANDPTEEQPSPYTYCNNNPICFVDPDGCVMELNGSTLEKNGLLCSY